MNSDVGPVIVLPGWIISNPAIPHSAFRLYAVIALRLALHGTEGTPSRETLAADMATSLDTVDRYTRILVKAGALALTKTPGRKNEITVCLCHPRQSQLKHNYPEAITPDAATHTGGGLRLNVEGTAPWMLKKTSDGSRKQPSKPLYIRENKEYVGSSTSTSVITSTSASTSTSTSTSASIARAARPLPRFVEAWDRYPNHQQRPRAQQQWLKMGVEDNGDLWSAVRDGVDYWAKYWDASATQSRFIPLFCHWLDRQQYEDRPSDEPALSPQSRGILLARKAFLAEPNK